MAYTLGGFLGQILLCLLVGYLFAGTAKLLFKAKPQSQFVASVVGALLMCAITTARDEAGTWVAGTAVAGFFYWRCLGKRKVSAATADQPQ